LLLAGLTTWRRWLPEVHGRLSAVTTSDGDERR
jgi:hypothetical protein